LDDLCRGIRIFCVGRNYVEHARELANPIPERPLFFMKPGHAIVAPGAAIRFPCHGSDLQHEVEVVVRIGKEGRAGAAAEALAFVDSLALGLDLTLRDVQSEIKKKGHPWEIAKAFEQSAPLGGFTTYSSSIALDDIAFSCTVNDQVRQQGNTRDLIVPIPALIVELSRIWTLCPGDLIYTGTPHGVGPLRPGDTVTVTSPLLGSFFWRIVERQE